MNSETIIKLEFEYIKTNVSQAISDRYTMLNFYIGICTGVGSVILGLLSLQNGEIPRAVVLGIGLLGIVTSVVGWIFVLIMIRLRQAWRESVMALNKIKDRFIEQDPSLIDVFLWKNDVLPRAGKLLTIHFYSTLLVIFLSSSFLIVSIGFLGSAVLGVILGIVNFATQFALYFVMLKG